MSDPPLLVATFTPSILLELARRDGSFNRAGLAVVETSVASSPQQFRSLGNGDVDLVFTSPDNVLAYRYLLDNPLGRTMDVSIDMAVDRGLGLALVLGPSHVPTDLRGGTIGVDVDSSGFAFVAYELLDRLGLSPGLYEVVALGSTVRRTDALIEGRCVATVLNAGNELRAVRYGASIVASARELGPYLGTVIASRPSADPGGAARRDRFLGVVRSTMVEVAAGLRREDTLGVAQALLGLTRTEAEEHYATLTDPHTGYVADGRVDRASLETILELRRRFRPSDDLRQVTATLDALVPSGVV